VYAFTQNKKVWQTSTGDARYRRGIYTMFYRSAPYPTLTTFDTPDFQSVCTRRQRSNTPLQALTMANDAALYELAQELAARALQQQSAGDHTAQDDAERVEGRLHLIYQRALGRPPSSSELQLVRSFLVEHTADSNQVNTNAAEANQADERQAWTSIARAIMNTDEFITRE
jgi:hypothetical protein